MIEIKTTNIDQLKRNFDPKIVDRALHLSNRKTAQKARTQISKLVRDTYNIKAADIGKTVSIKRKSGKDTDIMLFYVGQRISLKYFDARQVRNIGGASVTTYRAKNGFASRRSTRKSKSTGVTVRIRKDKGRESVFALERFGGRNERIKAFMAAGKGSNLQVFARDGVKRLPISKLTGPAVAQMVRSEDVLKKTMAFIEQEHVGQFQAHLEKLMNQVIK